MHSCVELFKKIISDPNVELEKSGMTEVIDEMKNELFLLLFTNTQITKYTVDKPLKTIMHNPKMCRKP